MQILLKWLRTQEQAMCALCSIKWHKIPFLRGGGDNDKKWPLLNIAVKINYRIHFGHKDRILEPLKVAKGRERLWSRFMQGFFQQISRATY